MQVARSQPQGAPFLRSCQRRQCCHCANFPADGSLGEGVPFSKALSPSPQFKAVLTDPGKGHLTSFLTREAIHMRCPLGAPCGQGLRFLHPSMPQTWHREARAPNTLAWELILSHLSSRQSTPSQAQGPSSIYHHVLLCSLPFSLHYCP